MIIILLIDFAIVVSLVAASRRGLENALPVFTFFSVLMPYEARLVIPGFFDVSTMRVALLTLSVLFLTRRDRTISSSPIPLKRLILLHTAWLVCSTFYSLSVVTSTKLLIAQVLEYYLLYYLFLRIISKADTVTTIAYAMMIAMGVCCIFGLLEAYASWSVLTIFPSNLWYLYNGRTDPLYIDIGRGLRIRSTFPHPILFGDALAMSIPIALYLLSVCKQQRQRIILWMIALLMFWGVYKTSSRGPWMTLGISSILLFFLVRNRVKQYLTVIALLTMFVLLTRSGIRQTIVQLYESTQDSSSLVGSSYDFRHALIPAVTNALAKDSLRMVVGYGLGTFREIGVDINFLNIVQRWHTCDDNWILFLYETGYVGLAIVTILLLRPLMMMLRHYRRMPRPENYFIGVIFISLAGFYFGLLSVAGYNWGQQGFMAWILISLSVVYPRIAMRDRRKSALSKVNVEMSPPGFSVNPPALEPLWSSAT
jgi:hypothetical protein